MSELTPGTNTNDDIDDEEFAENTLVEAIENQIASDNPPAATS